MGTQPWSPSPPRLLCNQEPGTGPTSLCSRPGPRATGCQLFITTQTSCSARSLSSVGQWQPGKKSHSCPPPTSGSGDAHPPDGLMLQGVWVCGIHCQQHAAHGDVLLLGHHHGVRVENWALVDVQDSDVDSGRGAGAIGDVGNQWVLVFHFDQQGVKGRNLIVQRLEGREGGSAHVSATKGGSFCTEAL